MKDYSALILPILITIAVGYLLGSVSFSIIITKKFKNKQDIRSFGSGNAGATNVLRSVGKLPALLTFVLDFLKCAVSVLAGYYIIYTVCHSEGIPEGAAVIGKYAAGLACIIGHIFPVYFSFRGGKGVVTTSAMIALLDWRVFILAMVVFVTVFAITHIVSISSMSAGGSLPIFTFAVGYLFDYTSSPLSGHGEASMAYLIAVTAASLLITVLLVIVHRENIGRLRRGEEKPISLRKG